MVDTKINFEDAGEFLRYLRLSSGNWGEGWESHWVFRGQEDHEWPLVPRAWRPSTLEEFSAVARRLETAAQIGWERIRHSKGSGFSTNDPLLTLVRGNPGLAAERVSKLLLQLAFEADVLRDFVVFAEELGYQAGDPTAHMTGAQIASYPKPKKIFNNSMREETGLAQHHGIPTRLLDWTRRPEVAAFFAALKPSKGRLAVWGLDLRACRKPTQLYSPTVTVHTCRRYRHSFLHAQDGLFAWIPYAESHYLDVGVWPSIPEVIENDREYQELVGVKTPLRKLTLSSSQRTELLRLLWRERISQAYLMPTYDYIAESLRLRWSLDLDNT